MINTGTKKKETISFLFNASALTKDGREMERKNTRETLAWSILLRLRYSGCSPVGSPVGSPSIQ